MAIPLATTTITVKGVRPQSDIDPADDDEVAPPEVIANGVRASISQPASSRNTDGADEIDEYALRCDLFDSGLTWYDTVIDEKTGVEYEVRVVALSMAELFGLQHFKATLRKGKGLSGERPDLT